MIPTASSPAAPLLRVNSVSKQFGEKEVLRALSLDIFAGEFLTLLGESGSGKTTLLRLIAGFERVTTGEIWMSGARLDPLPPYRRRVNTVFQHYALFPHLSVRENVAYGLEVRNTPKSEIAGRVETALDMVRMTGYRDAKPSKLSGGQQQRIALARALINRPELLLLDEPLSALDANLRKEMQTELKSLQREVGITFLFVTHDQDEAMALSDRIALLRDGSLEQVASPREIYERPATAYAAQFIGQTNLLRGTVRDGWATCGSIRFPTKGPEGSVVLSLRPEHITTRFEIVPGNPYIRFRGRLVYRTFHGPTELLEIDCDGQLLRARIPTEPDFDANALDRFEVPGSRDLHDFFFLESNAIRVKDSA